MCDTSSDRFTAEVKCFYDYSLIYLQLFSFSHLWLSDKCVCHALIAPPVVFVCVFVNAILTREGCRKCLWQVMTAYKGSDCLFGSVFAEWKKSFSGLLNVASVCVWMLSTGIECIFISTHVNTYCRVKMTFCQMQQRKPAGLRATVWHSERLVSCGSLCVFMWEF